MYACVPICTYLFIRLTSAIQSETQHTTSSKNSSVSRYIMIYVDYKYTIIGTIQQMTKKFSPSPYCIMHLYILIYKCLSYILFQVSDQISRSVMSTSLRLHELQHARPP